VSPPPDAARAAAVALAALPGIGPARHRALLDHAGGHEEAWALVRAGVPAGVPLRAGPARRAELVAALTTRARDTDPAALLGAHDAAGVRVLLDGDPDWPEAFAADPEPPAVLFARGEVGLLDEVAVAVVGTRRCSATGVHVARELGAGLTDAGVRVVSGLALGVDGVAHRAVLDAGGRPVGVVGSGLDRVYPPRHRQLWADVAGAGVLVSEAPLGVAPERWRFPARNRLIAALAAVVVVVESRRRGGSITTAEAALDRGRIVLAVPGSVLAEQSAGTNQLLAEGAGVARDVTDVLAALGIHAPAGVAAGRDPVARVDDPVARVDDPVARAVVDALGGGPVRLEGIAAAVGAPLADTVVALARLEAEGLARRTAEGYEQVIR